MSNIEHAAREHGFADADEMFKLVANVDVSTPAKMVEFKNWKAKDGTRSGLEPETKVYHILNLGAGVQSTALYLMSMRQDEPELVPVFDFAVFADTQEEPDEVYKHLEWLKSLGGPPILEGTAGKLGEDLLSGKNTTGQNLTRFASIPTFCIGEDDVEPGRNKRQCTKEYKTEPVEKTIRQGVLGLEKGGRINKNVRVIQYLGLSFDEPRRIIRVKERFSVIRWAEPRFPLFEMEMTRRGCVSYLETAAPGRKIPRSACVFCPFHDNTEWRAIRDNDPVGWARACEIDDALRAGGRMASGMNKKMFIHRSCVPLREAPIDTPESRGEQYTFGFTQECEGMCGV